jgi:hypothetical protein
MKTFFNSLNLVFLVVLFISCEKSESDSTPLPYSYLDEHDFIKDGLIGYYPFNGDIKDYSGNAYDAIALSPKFGVDRFNYSTGSIHLNGINDYLLIPDIGKYFIDNEGTIIFWSKIDTPYTDFDQPKPVVLSIVDSVNASFILSSQIDDLWYSYGMFPSLGGASVISSFNKEDFILTVLTFTDSSTSTYSYSNGSFVESTLSNPSYSFGFNRDRNNQDLYFGKSIIDTFESDLWDNYFTYFKGYIDDLLIYNRVLTEEEIMYIFDLTED